MACVRVVTTSELDEVVASLYSDKAKTREEGVKGLTTILDSSAGLMVLDQQTALLQSTSRITAWSWPGIADALCQCIDTEAGANKKRGPKPALAKAMRNLVQKAEDPGRPGKSLVLLRKLNRLMKHILYVLQEVPSFMSDYSNILRQVILNIEYRVRLNKKVYNAFVDLFFEKVKVTTSGDGLEAKEEAFQSAITLHSLLQNPPGDLSDVLKYQAVESFQDIFCHIRDEGRLAKKLLAALNVFLLSNGLNIADAVIKLHSSVRQFVFRTWLTTRDRELKDGLVLYARAQLQLRYVLASEDTEVVEELLELVEKELDQSGIALVGLNREERFGSVSRSMRCFLELAAAVIFEAHTSKSPINNRGKRRRTCGIHATVKNRLSSGKYFWIGALSMMVRRRGPLLERPILVGWLQGLASGFERVLTDASNSRSAEVLLWTLRCFHEFACLWPRTMVTAPGRRYQIVLSEEEHIWQSIWTSLLHWVPLLSNIPILVEEAFKLLGSLVAQNLVLICNVPHEFWSTQPFSETPSGHVLYFVTAIFSSSANQAITREDTELRSKLIDWTLSALDVQGTTRSKVGGEDIVSPRLLSAALLALSSGTLPSWIRCSYGFDLTSISLLDDLGCCLEPDVQDKADECEVSALNRSEEILAASGDTSVHEVSNWPSSRSSPLPRSKCGFLLQETSLKLVDRINPATILSISQLFHMIATVSACIDGVEWILHKRGQEQRDWSPGGELWKVLANMVESCIHLVGSFGNGSFNSVTAGSSQVQHLPSVLVAVQQFIPSGGRAPLVQANGRCEGAEESMCAEPLLEVLVHRLCENLQGTNEVAGHYDMESSTIYGEPDARTRLLDADLDAAADNAFQSTDRLDNMPGIVKALSQMVDRGFGLQTSWRLAVVQIISAIGLVLPDFAVKNLVALFPNEKDSKMRLEILREVFRLITVATLPILTNAIEVMQDSFREFLETEQDKYGLFAAIDTLFTNLLRQGWSSEGRTGYSLPEQVSSQISSLVEQVADSGMVLWPTRLVMGKVLASFILLDASAAQSHIDKLLGLLNDPEYRVRLKMSKLITVLFETWEGHVELLQDISLNLGLPTLKASQDNANSGVQTRSLRSSPETALITLGQLAFATNKVESEVVFMICTHAAAFPDHRALVIAVLDRLAKRLHYNTRLKYLEQLIGGVLHRWVLSLQPLASILEVQHILAGKVEAHEFLQRCCSWLLPSLLWEGDVDEIKWISNVVCEPVPVLLKRHFSDTFAALLLLHVDGSESEKAQAASVLQGSMLRIMEVTEDERDKLIRMNMVSIVHSLFLLCSGEDDCQKPYFSRAAIASAVQTVVDGFLEQDQVPQDGKIVDKLQVFRADRVFGLLLQIHGCVQVACHPRHRRYPLASVLVLLDIIDQRSLVPSTFRYLVHIILESIAIPELQEQCCLLFGTLLDKVDACPDEESIFVLGDHLQLIVSKLVSCYAEAGSGQLEKSAGYLRMLNRGGIGDHKVLLLSLLHRITVDAHQALQRYIKELDRFPDLPLFEPMRLLQVGSTLATEFVQFVKRAPNLSPQVRMTSLQNLCQQLPSRRNELYDMATEGGAHVEYRCKPEFVSAVWDLLQVCEEQDAFDIREMAAEFVAAIKLGDSHGPVSLLPEGFRDVSIDADLGIQDSTVKRILIQLNGYMTDSDVSNIVLAYTAMKGILATEKGHRVFQTLDSHTKSYLKVCSNGVNQAVVEGILSQATSNRESKPMPLDETKLWETSRNTYSVWVCRLVHSLVEHTEDTIPRLCQEILLHKTALAELMFPHVLGLLAGKPDPEFRLCRQISEQVAGYVFCEGNKCTRSIQLFLEAMNCLRVGYVATRMKQLPTTGKKRDNAKGDRGVSSSGKSSGARKSGSLGGATDSSNVNCQVVLDWRKVYWLQIDYLKTAQAAQQCAAYYTSALYVEHWCEETYGTMTLGEPDFSSDDALPLHVELLLTVCTKTSEPDSIYGVVRSHKLLSQLLVHENEGNWSKSVEGYDLLLRSSRTVASGTETSQTSVKGANRDWKYYKGLMKSLQQMGCSHVLAMYYLGLAQQKPTFLDDTEFKELQFEAAWRAGKWDLDYLVPENDFDHVNLQRNSIYHANVYSCLRSLLEGDEEIFSIHLKHARQNIVSCIAHASMESSQNVNPDIVRLKVLDCLSQAWEMRWRRSLLSADHDVHLGKASSQQALAGPHVPSDDEVVQLEQVCQETLKQMRTHYNLVEQMAAFCKTLYGVINRRDRVPCHLLQFARHSRKAKRVNHAAISLHELKLISSELMSEGHLTDGASSDLSKTLSAGRVEEAKVLWAQGHQELALNLARFVGKNSGVDSDLAVITCLTGKWLSETRSESSRDILDNYLKKAVELVGSSEIHKTSSNHDLWTQRQCRTHFHLAHYTDALYRSYEERLLSTEWKSALTLRQHKTRELEKLNKRIKAAAQGEQQQYLMRLIDLQKQLALDSDEAQHLQDDKNYFLSSCLRSYTTCLTTGNKYDLRVVFRLVSLWFNLPSNPEVIQQMRSTTKKVQSYKFLPLVYQIASRMGNYKEAQGSSTFQSALTSLVEKMVIEHPYHSLYQLLALANGDRVKAQQRSRNAFVVDIDKKQAAENLLERMKSFHPILLQQVKKMVEMYIKLAELETKKEQIGKKIAVPRDVRSVRQLELVPVITAHVPVDPSCSYSRGTYPYFQGLSDGIQVMHGVNAPKVIDCLGSDGQKYRQLAKSGDDDLRQDAVMEQLFSLVNTLLQDHPDTRKRCLSIRTYKVVPFTPSAGVLEWVNGTIPLGEYLLGGGARTGGAHGRYGEDDWTFGICREKMASEKDKRRTFEKVCQKFRPVMHHFFIENFSQPAEWFEKRLAYTRSVAASSMVGYIVGLGDRHSMNVLLDQATAEVVHIDLGVAFEQGLMLKTPERVPFRLTRDLVDGMGVSGVEGVFRRCCEATLSVMRMNKEALLTIIEVFIHDPLYRWALSPLKALQRQQEVSDGEDDSYLEDEDDDLPAELEGNKDAARALLRVKQKLDGYEGEMRSLEGQVQQLIQDAQDPERLCQMFAGWGAWL